MKMALEGYQVLVLAFITSRQRLSFKTTRILNLILKLVAFYDPPKANIKATFDTFIMPEFK
jgi:hypothetical protein